MLHTHVITYGDFMVIVEPCCLISSLLSNRWLRLFMDGSSSRLHLWLINFFYYTLKTFLIISSVMLASVLICDILSAIRHLICSNNYNWILNLNLINETLWTRVRSSLLISMLRKLNWFRLTSLTALVLLMWKWIGLFLRKNHILRCWGWLCLLNWIGALILISIDKTSPKKIGALIRSMKFFSAEVTLRLNISTLRPCIKYCCRV